MRLGPRESRPPGDHGTAHIGLRQARGDGAQRDAFDGAFQQKVLLIDHFPGHHQPPKGLRCRSRCPGRLERQPRRPPSESQRRGEEAAAADNRRVTIPLVRDGIETPFVLPGDAMKLRSVVSDRQVRLLVVDPLSAHLGANINSWKDDNVRRALAPLHAVAEESAAIVVVAHLNKGQTSEPLQRLGGSIGLAAARSVLLPGSRSRRSRWRSWQPACWHT